MKAALLILLVPFLAACDPLSAIEGKSPGKDYIERLSALEAGMAKITPPTQPVITLPVTTPPEPECIPVFRVVECP